MDIASEVFRGEEHSSVPPFLVLATDGIWDETSADTVVEEVRIDPILFSNNILVAVWRWMGGAADYYTVVCNGKRIIALAENSRR